MFILDRPTSTDKTYIFILISCDDDRLKKSLKLKLFPTDWSSESERPKAGKEKAIGIVLNRIYEHITALQDECLIHTSPFTTEKVWKVVIDILGNKQRAKQTFSEQADFVIEKMKSGDLLTDKHKIYSKGTVNNYGKIKRKLIQFAADKNTSVDFPLVTMDTYYSFKAWCFSQMSQKSDETFWTINFTGSLIKDWKGLAKAAKKLGLHHNVVFEKKEFKKISEDTDDIYLTSEELRSLETEEMNNENWDKARDWFLIAAYSGLRASDISLLNKTMFTKDEILIATEKTDEKVIIPIHPVTKRILKKWKGLPPRMHSNNINEYIKFAARKAKIDSTFLYTVTEGGKRKDYYFKKWQMVSMHTARRSFITNAAIANIPDIIIMKLTGIKSAATLMKYKKLSQNEAAKFAAQHSFFN